tara:strand:- start:2554 stop:2799 length:246 start_codon:yes stop_codon:yes gene_type:complete
MNDLTASLYLLCFVGIAGATFAFMWKMTTASLDAMNKPIKREVNIHPEMQDVRSGTSLLVFNANKEEDDDDDDGDIIVVRP